MVSSFFRSKLHNAAKTKALLSKIAGLYAQKSSRLVFQIGDDRFSASEATNVAIDANAVSNNIILTRPTGPTIKASKVVQALTYTAVAGGTAGNSIQIEYLDTGTAGAEEATVVGSVISVSMEAGVSTAQQILDAVVASEDASDLVTVALTGSNVAQAAASATNLTGGVNTEAYDIADILIIKRLRTKKYLIHVSSSANSAAA